MPIRSVFFDFMGTCLDWHTSVIAVLPTTIDAQRCAQFALAWRQSFFQRLYERHFQKEPPESINDTFIQSLVKILSSDECLDFRDSLGTNLTKTSSVIQAWHDMTAWPDVPPALEALRENGLELFVLANGSTRLQLDLVKSAGLRGKFDLLFSSQMLDVYKPDRDAYAVPLKLIDRKPEETVMVACHAYDLRAARQLGMNVIYVRRWTDDPEDDEEQSKEEFSGAYLDNSFDGLLALIQKL